MQTLPNKTHFFAVGSLPAGEVENGAGAIRTRANRLSGGLALVEAAGASAGGERGRAGADPALSIDCIRVGIVL